MVISYYWTMNNSLCTWFFYVYDTIPTDSKLLMVPCLSCGCLHATCERQNVSMWCSIQICFFFSVLHLDLSVCSIWSAYVHAHLHAARHEHWFSHTEAFIIVVCCMLIYLSSVYLHQKRLICATVPSLSKGLYKCCILT